jgi:methylmalonyl-CoA/ethylmalonyl-CoA epimerase
MSGIHGLKQVAQKADDLDRAVAFYRDTLGLPFLARFDPPGLAFFDLGGGVRLLLEGGASSTTLYLAVDDIDAVHQSLVDQGVTFEHAPQLVHPDHDGTFGEAGEGEWMAFFRDPDGNLLALVSRKPLD